MSKTNPNCHSDICVLEVLEPIFGKESGNIAMNYTCFPMDCEVAHKQAQEIVDMVTAGKTPVEALNIYYKKIEAEYERYC